MIPGEYCPCKYIVRAAAISDVNANLLQEHIEPTKVLFGDRQVTKYQHDAQARDRIACFFNSLRVMLVNFSLPISLSCNLPPKTSDCPEKSV